MSFVQRKLRSFWEEDTSLTILLVTLSIHMFIIVPLGQATVFGRIIFLVFYFFLLIAGMFVLLDNKRLRTITFALMILALCVLVRSDRFEIANDLITAFYCSLLGWVVLLRTFAKGPVTIHRILGAIVVYLLIAFIFALLYHFVYKIGGPATFRGLEVADRKEFVYFSFVTLTSTGYGDICAVLPFERSLANLEGLFGQLYPGIIIGRLVSMQIETSRMGKEK